jgi:hypothetical protein
MEYNEIPTAIKVLKDESQRCSYALEYDIPRCRNEETGKVKVSIGDRTIHLNTEALKTFINNQMLDNDNGVKRLEDIHDTLKKVAVGLI